jgi:hypothetical protein
MNFLKPKAVVHRADVRKRLREDLLVIGFTGPKLGRPKQTLLGEERTQLDILVGVRLIDAFLADTAANGKVVDPELDMYMMSTAGKRLYAAQLLNGLSGFTPHIVPGAPIQTLYKSLGPLIRIRRIEPSKRGDGGRYWYKNKDSATGMELLAAFNTHALVTQARINKAAEQTDIWRPALEVFPSDMTLMEAYAAEAADGLKR